MKPTGSGSCLLQHFSNRKLDKSLTQLPHPTVHASAAGALALPQGEWGSADLSSMKSWRTSALQDSTTSGKGKTPTAAQEKKHTLSSFCLSVSVIWRCCCVFSTALMLPGLENYYLMRPQPGGLRLHRS